MFEGEGAPKAQYSFGASCESMPGGEMVSHCPLEARFLVRVQAGQRNRTRAGRASDGYVPNPLGLVPMLTVKGK